MSAVLVITICRNPLVLGIHSLHAAGDTKHAQVSTTLDSVTYPRTITLLLNIWHAVSEVGSSSSSRSTAGGAAGAAAREAAAGGAAPGLEQYHQQRVLPKHGWSSCADHW